MSLSDYSIIKQLGSGTYSIVYEVQCKSTNTHFAMKEIKFDRLSAKEKQYTKTEIKILKEIHHPNLIKYEKSFSSGSNFYIIMELATEGDLQKKIQSFEKKHENFPLDTIWRYTYEIVQGLQALHANKILHRDIKASNIFIMQNDTVKIGDFNIGKEMVETTMCTKIGTPVMMSPEIWNGEPYNLKTDIWSLGCLVYQMAALNPPFVADSYAALYMKISKSKVPFLPHYPKALNAFIQKLLKKNPKQRPTCLEILSFEEMKKFSEPKPHVKALSLVRENSRGQISARKHHKSVFSPIFNTKINKKTNSGYFRELTPVYNSKKRQKHVSPLLERKPSNNSAEKVTKEYSSKILNISEADKIKLVDKRGTNFYLNEIANLYSAYNDCGALRSNYRRRVKKHCVSIVDSTYAARRPSSKLKSVSPARSPKPLKKVSSMIRLHIKD